MLPPAPAHNESERLRQLDALGVLDTPPEERFDRITRIAQRLSGVPTVLVSLVTADRQWFKSRVGFAATETPRALSFCGHAILSHQPLIVADTLRDERFHDNPYVTGPPHIRFYAGHPLVVGERSRIGTLCLIDDRPREFTDGNVQVLRDLAHLAEQEFATIRFATTDEVTGLCNRRGFETFGERLLAVCERSRTPAALLSLELASYAHVRDAHGPAEGDRALVALAGLLLGTFRGSDLTARVGTDRYAVLLTGADETGAGIARARLHDAVLAWNARSGRPYTLACHSAIVTHHAPGAPLAELLGEAERRVASSSPCMAPPARA